MYQIWGVSPRLKVNSQKRLLYLIGFAANTGNSSNYHTFKVVLLAKRGIFLVGGRSRGEKKEGRKGERT